MIAVHEERRSLWLRLKLLLTLGSSTSAKPTAPKPRHRSHRTTAFFEMP
jgi:hypothetical protein